MSTMPITCSLLILALLVGVLPAEEVVIINPATAQDTLPGDLAREYFLGQKGAWGDGSKVVVVLVRDDSAQVPLLRFLGRSQQQFEIGWKKLIFTGRVTSPAVVDSDEAVVARVASTPGAIGFVDRTKATAAVKAITIQ